MDLIVVLIVLGALLIFFDFFVPTLGLMSCVAMGMIVWAQVVAFRLGPATGWICLSATVALLATDVLIAYRLAKRFSLIHTAKVGRDATAAVMRDTLVGVSAKVLTPLRPSGKVEVTGKQYDARCDMNMIDAGTEVRVTEVRGRELVVRPVESCPPDQA